MLFVGLPVAGVVRFVAWDGAHIAACVWRAVCALFRPGGGRGGAVCPARTLRLLFGVHLVPFVGVAVPGVVQFVPRDGVHGGACLLREPGAVCRRRGGSGGSVCPAGRCARWGLCLACTSCCLSPSRWQGWFGLSRGTVCTVGLVVGVHLVPFVCVAVANVEVDMVAGVVRFVPRDGVHLAACVCRAAGDVCRRGGDGRGAGRGGGGGGAVCSAGWLARSDASCVWGVVAALRVGTSRRTRHVTTTSD